MKKLLLSIAGFLFLFLLLFSLIANTFYKHNPAAAVANSALITKNVLTSSASEKKTYVSNEDGYTVSYLKITRQQFKQFQPI